MQKYFILLVFTLLLGTVITIRKQDFVPGPPGMQNVTVYSGYLNTYQNDRKLHYVFVQADNEPEKAPLTIWLNGGPGCSSLIGYMQEVGPFIVGDTYKFGENLEKNPYGWNRASNMLFIESPGGVGFSSDTNPEINYNDQQTADDCFVAIKDFMWNVAPEFTNRALYISGQSYAGKYVPDLAVRIIDHNRMENVTYINLKGILIGNPIMNHLNNSLYKMRYQYWIDHDFVSERLVDIFHKACEVDFDSPRCQYFIYEIGLLRQNFNRYNIYEVCQTVGAGASEIIRMEVFLDKVEQKLRQIKKHRENKGLKQEVNMTITLKDIPKCGGDDGMIDYMNQHKHIYNVDWVNKNWSNCADIKYDILEQASMEEFRQIFLNKGVKVWLFSGDWDDQVPYTDTVYHLNELKRKKIGNQEPWFAGSVHAGFYQLYDSLTLITFKGSGHWVPFFKREASYQMFSNFINDKPINTPVQTQQEQ